MLCSLFLLFSTCKRTKIVIFTVYLKICITDVSSPTHRWTVVLYIQCSPCGDVGSKPRHLPCLRLVLRRRLYFPTVLKTVLLPPETFPLCNTSFLKIYANRQNNQLTENHTRDTRPELNSAATTLCLNTFERRWDCCKERSAFLFLDASRTLNTITKHVRKIVNTQQTTDNSRFQKHTLVRQFDKSSLILS